jgi:hypothetical protein
MSLARVRFWDLGPPVKSRAERADWIRQNGGDGPAEMDCFSVAAGEALERDPQRYVRELPEGMAPGPRTGGNRVIHC